jgi:hypothetical protein
MLRLRERRPELDRWPLSMTAIPAVRPLVGSHQ